MAKILLLAIAFAAAFWLLRHRRRAKRRTPPAKTGDMVGCAHCGLHLPREEGVMSGNRYFCSAAHEQEFNGKR